MASDIKEESIMERKKTVVGVSYGDRVTANHIGSHPSAGVTGRVIRNDEKCCIIRQDNGLTATIFGELNDNSGRSHPGVRVTKI